MARKRKRPESHRTIGIRTHPSKRVKLDSGDNAASTSVHQPTLRLFYSHVLTLREYLLARLPKSSKTRRRRLASVGRNASVFQNSEDTDVAPEGTAENLLKQDSPAERDMSLATVLNRTLICTRDVPARRCDEARAKDFECFSQQISLNAASSLGQRTSSQSELVDFAIWLLFHKIHRDTHRPSHLLCHGYQRATTPRYVNDDHCAVAGIPGIVSHYPNGNVNILKGATWADVIALVGKDGDQVMLDLLLETNIFTISPGGNDNYYQLSGIPLTDLQPLKAAPVSSTSDILKTPKETITAQAPETASSGLNSPAAITFVHSRMLYARPALNAKGKVTFGLRHIHALNRYSDPASLHETVHLLKYIFPRQFGLHNVFTSKTDPRETIQPFKDYTLREQEIAQQERMLKPRSPLSWSSKRRIPRRLRGQAVKLVQKLQQCHSRCSYSKLLEHHCPKSLNRSITQPKPDTLFRTKPSKCSKHGRSPASRISTNSTLASAQIPQNVNPERNSIAKRASLPFDTENSQPSLIDLATPQAQVSAFCRSVLSQLIPDGFWGEGEARQHNKAIIMKNIDRFIRLRKFESLTLHAASQRLKVRIH